MLALRKALRNIGCTTHEYGIGIHELVGDGAQAGNRPIRFDLDLTIGSLLDFLNPLSSEDVRGVIRCSGTFEAEGVVGPVPCTGTLALRLLKDNQLRYDLRFEGQDGRAYKFVGKKLDVRLPNLYRTLFTLYGTIFDEATGEELSHSILYFYRSTPSFLTNIRLRLRLGLG